MTTSVALARPRESPLTSNRLFYLDTLKVVLTILVVVHHIGQAYGPTGGAWPVQEATRAPVLGPFFTVNRSFFMSLFFMISGYFMVGAFERHGFGKFVKSRLVRLGVPVLVLAAFSFVFDRFVFHEKFNGWDDVFNAGPLWYLEHVLLFSIVYGLWRVVRGQARPVVGKDAASPVRECVSTRSPGTAYASRPKAVPGLLVTLAAALGVAVLSWLVRLGSPIDRWMNLLGFFRVAFADVPRDLAFFIFGAMAFHRGWFERCPTRRGMGWLAVGLAAAAAMYAWRLFPHPGIVLRDQLYSLVYPVWEELVAFGFCIGLVVAFRQVANHRGSFGKFLSANQYSVYFWHVALVQQIQRVVHPLSLGPLAKFGLVAAVALPLVFLWSALMRRIPAVRAVL